MDAVEVEEGGRPDSFDGNHTGNLVSWMMPFPGQRWEGLNGDQLETLMEWMLAGHMAWVVFPIDNVV